MPEVRVVGGRSSGRIDMDASFLCEVVGPIESRRLISLQARVIEVVEKKVKEIAALDTIIIKAEICLIVPGLQLVIGEYHRGEKFSPDIKSFLPFRGKGEIRVRLINVECRGEDES